MGTKFHSPLELMKLWDHAHNGDHTTFILEQVMAKPILAKTIFSTLAIFFAYVIKHILFTKSPGCICLLVEKTLIF